MMVWSLFIIDDMGLFFYNKIGSIISIGDLPTTNIIEPKFHGRLHFIQKENRKLQTLFLRILYIKQSMKEQLNFKTFL